MESLTIPVQEQTVPFTMHMAVLVSFNCHLETSRVTSERMAMRTCSDQVGLGACLWLTCGSENLPTGTIPKEGVAELCKGRASAVLPALDCCRVGVPQSFLHTS